MNNKYYQLTRLLNESTASKENFNFVLNLEKENFSNIHKIKRVPDIETIYLKDGNKTLYGVKYFCFDNSEEPKMIRITSESKDFSDIYSVDLYNKQLQISTGIQIQGMDKEKFLNFINDIVTTTKIGYPKQSTIKEEVDIPVKQSLFKKIISDIAENPQKTFFGIMIAMSLYYQYKYFIVKIINWFKERYVSGPLETKMNEELFIGQKKNDSKFSMYSNLINHITNVVKGPAPAFIICGPPGMSKTYIVRRTLHFLGLKPAIDYTILKGSSSNVIDIYEMLYYNRKKILILDDFDTPLRDESIVNLLKGITDSYSNRIISLPRADPKSVDIKYQQYTSVPSKFEFKGKLIIITNMKKSEINPALVSRAPTFEVMYNTKQIINAIDKMMEYISPKISMDIKREVFNYITTLYKQYPKLIVTFRDYQACLDARIGFSEGWKDMCKTVLGLNK